MCSSALSFQILIVVLLLPPSPPPPPSLSLAIYTFNAAGMKINRPAVCHAPALSKRLKRRNLNWISRWIIDDCSPVVAAGACATSGAPSCWIDVTSWQHGSPPLSGDSRLRQMKRNKETVSFLATSRRLEPSFQIALWLVGV